MLLNDFEPSLNRYQVFGKGSFQYGKHIANGRELLFQKRNIVEFQQLVMRNKTHNADFQDQMRDLYYIKTTSVTD